MAATIAQIRAGLKTRLETIDGVQVSAYPLASPTPPSVDIVRRQTDFDRAMGGGLHEVTFAVRVHVAYSSDVGAQMHLDDFVDPAGTKSVKAAIEGDRTLGGVIQGLHVKSASDDRVDPAGSGVLWVEFNVQVLI